MTLTLFVGPLRYSVVPQRYRTFPICGGRSPFVVGLRLRSRCYVTFTQWTIRYVTQTDYGHCRGGWLIDLITAPVVGCNSCYLRLPHSRFAIC